MRFQRRCVHAIDCIRNTTYIYTTFVIWHENCQKFLLIAPVGLGVFTRSNLRPIWPLQTPRDSSDPGANCALCFRLEWAPRAESTGRPRTKTFGLAPTLRPQGPNRARAFGTKSSLGDLRHRGRPSHPQGTDALAPSSRSRSSLSLSLYLIYIYKNIFFFFLSRSSSR